MRKENATYHRRGAPGGPGCSLAMLPISFSNADGSDETGILLDAGDQASEIELLRTVASRLGVSWGNDGLGWWAVVKNREFPSWSVWRQDDNGNTFLVESHLLESDAKALARKYEATGHKQTYWAKDTAPAPHQSFSD